MARLPRSIVGSGSVMRCGGPIVAAPRISGLVGFALLLIACQETRAGIVWQGGPTAATITVDEGIPISDEGFSYTETLPNGLAIAGPFLIQAAPDQTVVDFSMRRRASIPLHRRNVHHHGFWLGNLLLQCLHRRGRVRLHLCHTGRFDLHSEWVCDSRGHGLDAQSSGKCSDHHVAEYHHARRYHGSPGS